MFELPDLPYAYDALEPVISSRTMKFHHDKHHRTYVETTNALLKEAKASPDSLESAIRHQFLGFVSKALNLLRIEPALIVQRRTSFSLVHPLPTPQAAHWPIP